jgi:sporulation protein YlmC with PRC-barrel domain
MHLSDVMGSHVFATNGEHLGRVHDAKLVQDGPVLGESGAAFRVHALVVGRGSLASRLGYDREHREVKGPWLLRALLGRRSPLTIPWTAIKEIESDRIVVERAEGEEQ